MWRKVLRVERCVVCREVCSFLKKKKVQLSVAKLKKSKVFLSG